MKTFLLTSTVFSGACKFTFNASEVLINSDLSRADLSEKQQIYLLRNFPKTISDLKNFSIRHNSINIVEVLENSAM